MGSDHLPRNIDTTSKLGVTVGTNKLCGSDGSQVCMTAATWLIVRLIKQKHSHVRRRVRPSVYIIPVARGRKLRSKPVLTRTLYPKGVTDSTPHPDMNPRIPTLVVSKTR